MRRGGRRGPDAVHVRAPYSSSAFGTDEEQGSSDLGQLSLGALLRDEGAADALAAASVPARRLLDEALDRLIARGGEFCADDLHDLVNVDQLPLSGGHNVVGATFLRAAKAGRIRKVGYRPSTRPSSHGRVVAVWTAVEP